MRVAAAAVVAIVVVGRVAAAQPSYPGYVVPYPSPGEAVPVQYAEEEWYGWKIALSDAAAFATIIASGNAYDRSLGPDPSEDEVGNVGYLLISLGGCLWWTFGTPVVHLLERNPRGAGKSVAIRIAAPMAGVLAGALIDGPESEDDEYAMAGLLTGVAAASAIDALVFANRRELKTKWVTPQLAVTGSELRVGIAGSF